MAEITIQGTDYTLPAGVTVIGRGQDADIVVDGAKLSRMHARLTVTGRDLHACGVALGLRRGRSFSPPRRLEALASRHHTTAVLRHAASRAQTPEPAPGGLALVSLTPSTSS